MESGDYTSQNDKRQMMTIQFWSIWCSITKIDFNHIDLDTLVPFRDCWLMRTRCNHTLMLVNQILTSYNSIENKCTPKVKSYNSWVRYCRANHTPGPTYIRDYPVEQSQYPSLNDVLFRDGQFDESATLTSKNAQLTRERLKEAGKEMQK
uniref:Uncharacterized protein n=1 Tax=Romanomermis culicivorax TaxID=13658 RepID=A0A915I2P2_ROMCU